MFLPRFPTLLALCLSRKKNNSRLQFADELLKAEPQHESGGGGGARNANTLCGKKSLKNMITAAKTTQNVV